MQKDIWDTHVDGGRKKERRRKRQREGKERGGRKKERGRKREKEGGKERVIVYMTWSLSPLTTYVFFA